jgi:hypothetical protein
MKNDRVSTSQANGALSRGPVTEEGKRVSSQNATRHGIFSRIGMLEGESAEAFDFLFAQICEQEQAVGIVEEAFCERMALAIWRQRRLVKAERSVLVSAAENFSFSGRSSSTSNLDPDHPDRVRFDKAMVQTIQFDKIVRYQADFDNQFARALKGLHAAQKHRQSKDRAIEVASSDSDSESTSFTDAVLDVPDQVAPDAYNPPR